MSGTLIDSRDLEVNERQNIPALPRFLSSSLHLVNIHLPAQSTSTQKKKSFHTWKIHTKSFSIS